MSENADSLARLRRRDGRIEARMTRVFGHGMAEVWRALTGPTAYGRRLETSI